MRTVNKSKAVVGGSPEVSIVKVVTLLFALLIVFSSASTAFANPHHIRVLIIDGQNNHNWQETTPELKKILEDTGLFDVDILTAPPHGSDMSSFKPAFKNYRVIVSNYNGDPWPSNTQRDFEKYMRRGGGFVCYHAADNAFPAWHEYNLMIGLGGWGGRDETSGPLWYYSAGEIMSDDTPGRAGKHGMRKPFQVISRDINNPIIKSLPQVWMHTADELYSRLRGPGRNMTVLSTAFSDPANSGSGHDEPMLMTIRYGRGRIFHTTLGHDLVAMQCVGFITTLQRGTEWAATGKVIQAVPKDFPTADEISSRSVN
jgi:type 1 glutamine amidotransferase